MVVVWLCTGREKVAGSAVGEQVVTFLLRLVTVISTFPASETCHSRRAQAGRGLRMQKIASYYHTSQLHGMDEAQVKGLKEKLGLTDAQLSELWDAFRLFDKNGDGSISPLEITAVMRSLGLDAGEGEVETMIRIVDSDGNGEIDFCEFANMMSSKFKELSDESVVDDVFKVFDSDGKGNITAHDLLRVISEVEGEFDKEEALEMFAAADEDGSGQIDLEEFTKMMMAC